jgi:hypothetical protein
LPLIDPAAHLILFISVSFLNLAGEFIIIAFDLKQIVIRESAPLLFQFAFELLPLPFELIAVHTSSLSRAPAHRVVSVGAVNVPYSPGGDTCIGQWVGWHYGIGRYKIPCPPLPDTCTSDVRIVFA